MWHIIVWHIIVACHSQFKAWVRTCMLRQLLLAAKVDDQHTCLSKSINKSISSAAMRRPEGWSESKHIKGRCQLRLIHQRMMNAVRHSQIRTKKGGGFMQCATIICAQVCTLSMQSTCLLLEQVMRLRMKGQKDHQSSGAEGHPLISQASFHAFTACGCLRCPMRAHCCRVRGVLVWINA